MKRRDFIALGAGALALGAMPVSASVQGSIEYTPGLVEKHLAKGETVFLDFSATWCGTCKAQERVINALNSKNAAYGQAITFVNVDWDKYGRGDLSAKLNIPRRSTLVVLKGDAELGRVVAGTSKKVIKKLMDVALSAATA